VVSFAMYSFTPAKQEPLPKAARPNKPGGNVFVCKRVSTKGGLSEEIQFLHCIDLAAAPK
jgi:hypothetical protein